MAAESYDVGDVLRVHASYQSIDEVPFDPSVVKFSFRDPDGNVTTYTYSTDTQLVRTGTGEYYCDVDFSASGAWRVRHYSTGIGKASGEKTYFVRQSAF